MKAYFCQYSKRERTKLGCHLEFSFIVDDILIQLHIS